MDVTGTVTAGFEPVRTAFEAGLAGPDEVGAACCVYVEGRPVVDLVGGRATLDGDRPYDRRTLQLVASATKGALAICAHRLVERGELDLDAPVAAYWPEFAAAGKAGIPVRRLLDHRSGVVAVDSPVSLDDVVAWDPIVAKVAASAPVWEPGTRHGYHAVTYGWLVGEVLARITGCSPGELLAREVSGPLGLDLHLGLPASEHGRVSALIPAPPQDPPDPLGARMLDPTELAYRAFLVADGLLGWFAEPRFWSAQLPAGNGMATAHALARMYAACLDEVDGVRLLAADTLAAAVEPQSEGLDAVTGYRTRYGLGFQLAFPNRPMAGPASFGHYGMGGSTGFADTRHGFAFGYTANRMAPGAAADPRSAALVEAVLSCLG